MHHGVAYLIGEFLSIWLICKILELLIINRVIKNFYICIIVSSIVVLFFKAYLYVKIKHSGYGVERAYINYEESVIILIILPVFRSILNKLRNNK